MFGAGILRMLTVFLSARNIKRLKQEGAKEYGERTSQVMSMLHVAFYVGCLVEAAVKDVRWGVLMLLGIILYAFSMLILWLVIRQLGSIWTIKLVIAQGHQVNKSPLFKYVRHPNYLLNIIPELLSLALASRAWITLVVLSWPYLFILIVRIIQEEAVMKQTFPKDWTDCRLLAYLPRFLRDWAERGIA